MKCGEKHHRALYTDELVARCRERKKAGEACYHIAKTEGIPYFTVRDWIKHRTRTCNGE